METNKKRARSEEVPVSKEGTAGRAGTWVRNKECGRAGRRERGRPEPDGRLWDSCLQEPSFIT